MRSDRSVVSFVACGYLLLVVAWAVANPAGASPDENDHYLRALAVGRGDFRGGRNPQLAGKEFATPVPKSEGAAALTAAWAAKGARLVQVPGGLGPHDGFGCTKFDPRKTAKCLNEYRADAAPSEWLSTMGTVEPTAYVLPGLATRFADDPVDGLRLARLSSGAVVAALLAAAVMVLWSWSPAALTGLLLALTPSVVFIGSMLSPSAMELAGAACFFAALFRAAMGPPGGRWTWVALGAAGVILGSSRSLGPVWIVVALVVVLLSEGLRASWNRFRAGGRWAAAAGGATAVAIVFTVWWEAAFQPGIDFDSGYFRQQLIPAMGELRRVGYELIGVFGWIDTGLPPFSYSAWTVMLAALATLALLVGSWRQRVLLVLLVPAFVVVTLFVAAGLMRQNGFDIQGRHVLAMAMIVPLFAASVLAQNRQRLLGLWPRHLLLWFAVPVAGIQALAFYVNARRYAVGIGGPVNFLGSSEWQPPGGWLLWLGVVSLGVISIVVGAVMARGPAQPGSTESDSAPAPAIPDPQAGHLPQGLQGDASGHLGMAELAVHERDWHLGYLRS